MNFQENAFSWDYTFKLRIVETQICPNKPEVH